MMSTRKNEYEIIIIGAGVIGCNIARELSKYDVSVLLLEKENDVSCGASKANSGIVHGGFDDKHGSVKAQFSRAGNRKFRQLDQELNFGYLECGSLVLGFDEEDALILQQLKENGMKNGVNDLEIIDRKKVIEIEPNVNPEVKFALYCKTSGVTSPYEFTIALCENAIQNGVTLELRQEVKFIQQLNQDYNYDNESTYKDYSIRNPDNEINIDTVNNRTNDFIGDLVSKPIKDTHNKAPYRFKIITQEKEFYTNFVINAAGVNSDQIAQMLGITDFSIIPRKGEYLLLNKSQGQLVNGVIFQTPTIKGKGILVTRTFHGNLMLGPNAQEVATSEDIGTQLDVLKNIIKTARKSVKEFDLKYTLNSFAGIRATCTRHDFIIEESEIKGFIQVAGIESPGLTSSPAIAEYVVELLMKSDLVLLPNPNFSPNRKGIIIPKKADFDGKIDDPDPKKNIICRCEKVTESEIIEALHRGIHIDHIDGVKRRTRCTMGECQGHFCETRVAKIIAREVDIDVNQVTRRGKSSFPLPPRENRLLWKKIQNDEEV
jgi:glycerol-3-phosphate dehydrogenase